jgi:hypothetical protein
MRKGHKEKLFKSPPLLGAASNIAFHEGGLGYEFVYSKKIELRSET